MFGCLVEGNHQVGPSSTSIGLRTSGNTGGSDKPYVVNCTLADNVNTESSGTKGVYVGTGNWGTHNVRFINSIISSNNGVRVDRIMPMATSLIYGHGEFQGTTLNESVYEDYRQWVSGSITDLTATVYADTLAFPTPGFHSVDDSGNVTQNLLGLATDFILQYGDLNLIDYIANFSPKRGAGAATSPATP